MLAVSQLAFVLRTLCADPHSQADVRVEGSVEDADTHGLGTTLCYLVKGLGEP